MPQHVRRILLVVAVLSGALIPLTQAFPTFGSAAPAQKYVALGDSYSSGEGVPPYGGGTGAPYFRDTNSKTNQCHDSETAWPVLVAEALGYYATKVDNFEDWPCSGAVVANVWGTGGPSNPGVGTIGGEGQWTDPPQITHVDSSTNMVSITIGGNDIGFGTLGYDCAAEGWLIYLINQYIITPFNQTYINPTNAQIVTLNADIASVWPSIFGSPPSISTIAPVSFSPSPLQCTLNADSMLDILEFGGAETICTNGTTVEDPVPGTVTCPAPQTTYNFVAPSLTQLYNQIASQAAPNAKIYVMAYPPLLPPSLSSPCSINVTAKVEGKASFRFPTPDSVLDTLKAHPAVEAALLLLLPTSVQNLLFGGLKFSYSLSHSFNLAVPFVDPTAATALAGIEVDLNSVIQTSVANTGNPNIIFVNPYANIASANGGAGGWFCNASGGTTTVNPLFNQVLLKTMSIHYSFSTTSGSALTLTPSLDAIAADAKRAFVDPGTFHPNAAGHQAIACALLATVPTSASYC